MNQKYSCVLLGKQQVGGGSRPGDDAKLQLHETTHTFLQRAQVLVVLETSMG